MNHKKIIALLLILIIIAMSIIVPVQEAQAIIPAIIALGELAPGIIAAIVTLAAAGVVYHSTDIAVEAGKAYQAASGITGTINDSQIIIGATAVAGAKMWLDSWVPTITESTSTYSQTVGTIVPATASQGYATGADVHLITNMPIYGSLGLRTFTIQGWEGIRNWLTASDNQVIFKINAQNLPQILAVTFYTSYYMVTYPGGGFDYFCYPISLADISAIRFSADLVTDVLTGLPSLDIGMQYISDTMGTGWIWEAPVLSHVSPDGISISMNTNTATATSLTADFPITYAPGDITYTPSVPADYTVPYPTTWDTVIDQTIDDMSEPVNPPIDPPTSVLDWLSQLWAWLQALWNWIQQFWAWIKTIPGLIAESILQLDVPLDIEPLRIAGELLTTRFPFSLPWDLYRSVASLTVAPSFEPLQVSFWNPLNPS
ncbi:MAG: hypothetical protein PHP79_08315, partial [Clostridia bacterium]|nr:hypothetical protein [Clostridia bacterium]